MSEHPAGRDTGSGPTDSPLPRAEDDLAEQRTGEHEQDFGETVGASDAEADAARSGGDVEMSDVTTDSDNVPVGRDDADADARRSGSDA